jgi:PleD family two-component response regulator
MRFIIISLYVFWNWFMQHLFLRRECKLADTAGRSEIFIRHAAALHKDITTPLYNNPMIQASIKILVVDYEPQIVRVLKAYLEQSGYQVSTAADGKAAIVSFQQEIRILWSRI